MRGLRTRIEIDINNNIELVSRAILQKMESLISALFSNHLVACSSTCNAVGIGPSAPSLFLLGNILLAKKYAYNFGIFIGPLPPKRALQKTIMQHILRVSYTSYMIAVRTGFLL